MKSAIAIATSSRYLELTPDDQRFMRALERLGIIPFIFDWRSDQRLFHQPMPVLIRSPWDYMEALSDFREWLDRLDQHHIPVFNSTSTIRKNLDKLYLRSLEALDIPMIPTTYVETDRDCNEMLQSLNAESVYIVKPSISAGAWGLIKDTGAGLQRKRDELLGKLQHSALLVQEYDREITQLGEWSFVYFGGKFSHAVLKLPAPGDFRVQWTHGGTHAAATPSSKLMAKVEQIAQKTIADLAFARIDGIERAGEFYLMELELFEPYLFFAEAAGSEDRLATVIAERMLQHERLQISLTNS